MEKETNTENNSELELELAKLIQFNEKSEAQAVLDYTEMLKVTLMSSLEEADKKIIEETLKELIADELNHQEKLKMLYTMLTGIEPNKD